MIKACIFDLDGTLADTLESMAYSGNAVLRHFSLKELPVDNYRYYCGDGASMLVRRILKDGGDVSLSHLKEAELLYRRIFGENSMYHVRVFEGIPETLQELLRRGIKLGVCSNKPHAAAVKVIRDMFGDIFSSVLGQQEGIARKPAPDAPLMLAREFGAKPAECMYIGDTGTDMQTGKAAGMYTVGAVWGFRDKKELMENGADILAEKPEDLLKICEEYRHD